MSIADSSCGPSSRSVGLPVATITKHEVALEPPIPVFNVELQKGDGSWKETFGTEVELRAFLKGVQAGCSMSGVGFFREPEIPQKVTATLRKVSDDGECSD